MRRARPLLLIVACSTACAVACSDTSGSSENVGQVSQAYTTQCATSVVEGVDVYDGQGAIDWTKLAGSGRGFAFIKASQGNYDTQSTFAEDWTGALAAGVLRSPYHFFDATIDGVTQANYYLAIVNAQGGFKEGDLPPLLDIECPTSSDEGSAESGCEYTGNSGWAPTATLIQRAFDWLTTVEAATHRKPIIYSYPSWFGDVEFTDARLAAYPLYIASYASCASVPAPWTSAVFWQYGDNGTVPGITGTSDVDRFFGTAAQLAAFAAVVDTPDAGADVASSSEAGVDARVDDAAKADSEVDSAPSADTASTTDEGVDSATDAVGEADGAVTHSPGSVSSGGCAFGAKSASSVWLAAGGWGFVVALARLRRRRASIT